MSLGRRVVVPVVAIVVTALVGCGVTEAGKPSGGAGGASTTTEVAVPARSAKEVLAEVRGSVALVETAVGSGSAVLTDDGYLVTNAHVVDPMAVVDVTFEGDDPLLDVEVVGVDLVADIAVLGPIDTDHEGLAIDDPTGLDQGSGLYLVGYPGDPGDPQVTITSGVLSRWRGVPDWDIDFLQSDAKIAPGQSGGALVDERGRVIGISGLSDDDGYALSLSGADVAAAVAGIVAGEGSAWSPMPDRATEREVTFQVAGASDVRTVYLPAGEGRSVTIGIDGPDPLVALEDLGGYPLDVSEALYSSDADDGGDFDVVAADPDGRWTFTVPSGEPTVVRVGSEADGTSALRVTSTEPFAVVGGDPEVRALAPGVEDEGQVGYFDDTDVVEVELAEGDEVEITVGSATGDLAFTVVGPGGSLGDSEEFDDGGGGLFDLDAVGSHTATAAGTHRIWVYQVDGIASTYRIRVDLA
jgi:hypothetical protein